MKLIAFVGDSGAGKTTLMTGVLRQLKARGGRVSAIKHAPHGFDLDHEGKDSFRHREAGAFEMVLASHTRLALMREFETPFELSVHHLIAELYPGVDWVLVEGFRDADIHKIEVWRPGVCQSPRYPVDDFISAIATDSPQALPEPTGLPVLDIHQPAAVADWLIAQGQRLDYDPALYT